MKLVRAACTRYIPVTFQTNLVFENMPNSNGALITLIKKGVNILSTNLINMMGMLSCPTDFFIGNKLIVLNSSLHQPVQEILKSKLSWLSIG